MLVLSLIGSNLGFSLQCTMSCNNIQKSNNIQYNNSHNSSNIKYNNIQNTSTTYRIASHANSSSSSSSCCSTCSLYMYFSCPLLLWSSLPQTEQCIATPFLFRYTVPSFFLFSSGVFLLFLGGLPICFVKTGG